MILVRLDERRCLPPQFEVGSAGPPDLRGHQASDELVVRQPFGGKRSQKPERRSEAVSSVFGEVVPRLLQQLVDLVLSAVRSEQGCGLYPVTGFECDFLGDRSPLATTPLATPARSAYQRTPIRKRLRFSSRKRSGDART